MTNEGKYWRAIAVSAFAGFASDAFAADDEPAPIGYASVAGVLAALRADPSAEFRNQRGWTVVASREAGDAVEWFFTPEGHDAHPAVVKRTAIERDGGMQSSLEKMLTNVDDQLLANLVRGAAGQRATEIMSRVLSRTRRPEFRQRVVNVLRTLRESQS